MKLGLGIAALAMLICIVLISGCTEEPVQYTLECGTAYCDAIVPCPEGKDCYKFREEEMPVCCSGDPCERCESKKCIIAESYPMQVFCQ